MCRGQRGRHANQIAAFDFWGMPGLIYLTLHTAESTLIGGVVIYSFVFLFLEPLKNIGRVEVGNSWNSVSPPLSVIKSLFKRWGGW